MTVARRFSYHFLKRVAGQGLARESLRRAQRVDGGGSKFHGWGHRVGLGSQV